MSSVYTSPVDEALDVFEASDFLRSINVTYDIGAPERIEHYYPTSKGLKLLRSLTQNESSANSLIVAPYGSGKSLIATIAAHIVENTDASAGAILRIARRIHKVDEQLAGVIRERVEVQQLEFAREKGFAVVLSGAVDSLPRALGAAIQDGFDRHGIIPTNNVRDAIDNPKDLKEIIGVFEWIKDNAASHLNSEKLDRIIVFWDEFGRHLENLVEKGRASDLNDVQTLAEWIARQRKTTFHLALFLHQSLSNYASNAPETVRREWRKIEGRFETLQYVDDSAELYELVARLVTSLRSEEARPTPDEISAALEHVSANGVFAVFDSARQESLLRTAYPLTPAALYLLPRIAGRVSQHERTIFSFVMNTDLSGSEVGADAVFDFFSDSLRSDSGPGGAYQHWLQAQNSIASTDNEDEIAVLKTACLLGLGVAGERSRVSKQFLVSAVAGYESAEFANETVEGLIERKLLMYRRTTDQVALWHGADIDLRGKLEDEKTRIALGFNLLEFLSEELPPRSWFPLQYNTDFRITRYLSARYLSVAGFESLRDSGSLNGYELGQDGVIFHIIPDDGEELATDVDGLAGELGERTVVSIPQEQVNIYDAALEVASLRSLQDDVTLTSEDPMVLPELQQMTDDATDYLRRVMNRLVEPGPKGPFWVSQSGKLEAHSPASFRNSLSALMRHIFPATPALNNELIVRHAPSPTLVNARKKLVAAILDSAGQENLALEGFGPQVSMFRTLLLRTGLYRWSGDSWRFASVDEVDQENLRHFWDKWRELMTAPNDGPKDLSAFFAYLLEPPIGVRRGVLPIFFASALRAFPSSNTLSKDGEYVSDILPSTIENICKVPEDYEFRVFELNERERRYLKEIDILFRHASSSSSRETDLFRRCFDALLGWEEHLAPAAWKSRRVTKRADIFRKCLGKFRNPAKLFLDVLPKALEFDLEETETAIDKIRDAKEGLEAVVHDYYASIEDIILDSLQIGTNKKDLLSIVGQWISLIPDETVEEISHGVAQGIHARMKIPYEDSATLIDSLASLVVGKVVSRWDDSTLTSFDRQFRAAITHLETHALRQSRNGNASENLAHLAEARIRNFASHLSSMVGEERARQTLRRILEEDQL